MFAGKCGGFSTGTSLQAKQLTPAHGRLSVATHRKISPQRQLIFCRGFAQYISSQAAAALSPERAAVARRPGGSRMTRLLGRRKTERRENSLPVSAGLRRMEHSGLWQAVKSVHSPRTHMVCE